MSDLNNDVKQILLDGFRDLSKQMSDMRSEMAGVKAVSDELQQTRHQLRDEMNGHLGQFRVELNAVKSEQSEKRGRDKTLSWLAAGGAGSGIFGALFSYFNHG